MWWCTWQMKYHSSLLLDLTIGMPPTTTLFHIAVISCNQSIFVHILFLMKKLSQFHPPLLWVIPSNKRGQKWSSLSGIREALSLPELPRRGQGHSSLPTTSWQEARQYGLMLGQIPFPFVWRMLRRVPLLVQLREVHCHSSWQSKILKKLQKMKGTRWYCWWWATITHKGIPPRFFHCYCPGQNRKKCNSHNKWSHQICFQQKSIFGASSMSIANTTSFPDNDYLTSMMPQSKTSWKHLPSDLWHMRSL